MNCSKMPEAIAGGSHPPDPMIMTELPTISLESITPPSWTSDMESLIRNCYNYFGSERLLHEDTYSPAQPKASTSTVPLSFLPCELVINERKSWDDVSNKVTTTTRWDSSPVGCNNQDVSGGGHISTGQCRYTDPASCASFMEIYICYHCERQFTNKDAMRIHQNACSHRPDNQPGMQTPPPALPPPHPFRSPNKILPIHGGGGGRSRPLTRHQTDEDRHRTNKESFLKYFRLVQTHKAEKLKSEKLKSRRNTDVDCQIIDVEPHDSVQQTSPRTPKSLISQLSREGEPGVHRKRLCYPTSTENDADSGDNATSNNVEDIEAFKKSSKTNSLLCIDISSLLGLRIQKHVKAETTLQALPDIEQYCKTPEKNDALERLRTRPIMYPITFRNSKKTNTKYSHEYKFTKAQQKEFMKRVQTGLNKQSRMLKRTLKSCSVRLRRLSREEIKKWTTPKRDARVNIQPLTHDQILLWTSKREYLKDSQNISSLHPWSPQKFPSKSFPTNRPAGPMRRLGYHYYKMGSPVHKKVRKPPHPMTIYKSVYSNNSTSKAKPLADSRQFIPPVKHPLNDSHAFNMRHPTEHPRFLNNRAASKPDQVPPHFINPYSSLNPELLSSPLSPPPSLPHQAYRNLTNHALTPQFLVRHMETRSTISPPPLVVIPVLGPPPDQAIPGLGMHSNHGLTAHGILPSQEQPLKLVNKPQRPPSEESSNVHNKLCDDNVSIHTISSDSEDEDLYVTRCTICKRGPCECPPTECFRFLPCLQPKPAHQPQPFHTYNPNLRLGDQNISIAAAAAANSLNCGKTIDDTPLRVIVNYNKYHHHNNNSNTSNNVGGNSNNNLSNNHHGGSSSSLVSSEFADGSRCLSSPGEQQISPKHVYAPIIKSVSHREKPGLKQYLMSGSGPDICNSSPLKVISRVEAARGSKLFNEDLMENNHAGSSLSHNKYYSNPQRTKSWHNAYNSSSSSKIRAQKVGQSPNRSDLDDDDIQILEEVICID